MNNQQAGKLDESLVKITKGAGIIFVWSLVGHILALLGKVMVARIGSESEYGVFSIAFAVLSFCTIIATLGLEQGSPRSIAFARGQKDEMKVYSLVPASLQFSFLAGVLVGIIIFTLSDNIASGIFNDSELSLPLKVIAFGIPFLTLITVTASVFRGFDMIKPKAYFQEFLRNALFPVFLIPIIVLDMSFDMVFYLLNASLILTAVISIVYTLRKLPSPLKLASNPINNPIAKELLLFSLPLLAVAMMQMIIMWIDTFMLGILRSSEDVGLYNAAHPLAQIISMPLTAILLMYMPVVSYLFGQGEMKELQRNFSILTKWLCMSTLPLFLILFLFPDVLINLFFGAGYEEAEDTLRILSLGFIFNNIMGPNGATLIALGRPQFMMWAAFATAVINIVLNAILIPHMGIEGAAIASVVALTSINIVRCIKLYAITKIQPLSKNLVKPFLYFMPIVVIIHLLVINHIDPRWWMLPPILVFYYIAYLAVTWLTNGFDREDATVFLIFKQMIQKVYNRIMRT